MNKQPYFKELLLNCSYDEVCKHILIIANEVKAYTLVSESKTLNRYVIKDTGINIEVNVKKESDDSVSLKIMTCSDKGVYFQAESIVMKIVSRFEEALCASIDGKLDSYSPKSSGIVDAEGCSSMFALIGAIALIIFALIMFFS